MDELNIRVNEIFDLLSIIEKVSIVCLNLMLDHMIFMYEASAQELNIWIKKKPGGILQDSWR